jgi:peptidoglycan/LPS O-acetylase OafA/YrhL
VRRLRVRVRLIDFSSLAMTAEKITLSAVGLAEEPRLAPGFLRDHRVDMLRGVSILVVLILHFHLAYDLASSPFAAIFSAKFVEALARNGNYGVTIFFVISGYLITSTALRRFGSLANVSARHFYSFRFARICPCLVLLLSIITPLGIAGIPYFASDKPVSFFLADLSILSFWHNVLMAKVGYFNYGLNILWSLSVEEVFYITFPLLCLVLRKNWLIICVWIAAIVYGPVYRSRHLDDDIHYLYGYFACFDAIAMGCCTALLAQRMRVPSAVRNAAQAGAAVFIAWIYLRGSIGDHAIFGPTLVAAGAALFLLVEGASRPSPGTRALLRFEPLGWFGRHSYELYLFHIVVLALMRNVVDNEALRTNYKPLWFLAFVMVSAMAAAIVARYYSEPLNHRIRKLLVRDASV